MYISQKVPIHPLLKLTEASVATNKNKQTLCLSQLYRQGTQYISFLLSSYIHHYAEIGNYFLESHALL